jgi:hypothetical protein
MLLSTSTLPTSSLLLYPQCIHEIHHHQLTTLTQESLKAKEQSSNLKSKAKSINHYSLLVIPH